MTLFLDDGDIRLYHGDALETVRQLPGDSVDCVVTSPPYWGLRDYGTEGQMGLEETPDLFVAGMVELFREIRRVLAPHGTCFVNIGDSYYSNPAKGGSGPGGKNEARWSYGRAARRDAQRSGTPYTEPQDSPGTGSACLDLCGECADDLANRTGRSAPPQPVAAPPASQTDRDSEPRDSGPTLLAASPPDAQASTTPESSPPPPVTCWRCGTRPASVSLPFAPTSAPDGQASAHTEPSTSGKPSTLPSSDSHTSDTEPSGLAHLYSTIAARRLKPKDAVLIPQLLALALQLDGWYVRSEIVWAKSNPMPESVTDRPTKSHETIWMLTKQPRYWFDTEAVREPHSPDGRKQTAHIHATDNSHPNYDNVGNGNERWPNGGRNVRSVWQIATQPYPEAHFATYPEELARRCILAGCPVRVCRVCGKPSERIVERGESDYARLGKQNGADFGRNDSQPGNMGQTRTAHGTVPSLKAASVETLGWSDCGHNQWRPGTVLDPFIGSGTTAKVARDHQRHTIGIDLNREYLELAARRLQQLSLLNAP